MCFSTCAKVSFSLQNQKNVVPVTPPALISCKKVAQFFLQSRKAFHSSKKLLRHQQASFTAIKSTKRHRVSEWVSDKQGQWSDSGPIKNRPFSDFLGALQRIPSRITKHRKNCECCPGHRLIVNHYSSMSWLKFCNLSVTVNCVTKSLIH